MQNAITRASQPLTDGFLVSCYKHYTEPNQQTVMHLYEVLYHTTGTAWDGTVRPYWTYDDVNGQYLRYWDYSGFPYRFNAIAPCPVNKSGYDLTDEHLNIPARYYAQTCINGMITPADNVAEPHLIAQVQRATDGTDTDLLVSDPAQSEINNGSTTKSRDVWMPFHHINSKIRFGVYHTTQWLTANKTYIENLTVSVTSSPFTTEAAGYQASGTGSWKSDDGFTSRTTVTPTTSLPHEIFRFGGGESVEGNDLTEKQTRKTAYFLQCTDGMMQIPQKNVQMMVSFDLMREDGTLYQSFHNVPVRLELDTEPVTYQYSFDWNAGVIHTYYLVIGEIADKLEITFTATLTPWEDVTGNLSTDLEK